MKKTELRQIIREEIQRLTEKYWGDSGMSFDDAVKKAKPNEKIIFSVKTNKFHIVDKTELGQFTAPYAFSPKDAKKAGKQAVVVARLNL